MPRMTRVRIIRPGVRELLRSEPVEREMGRRAERVAKLARGIAPFVSGDYMDSIEASTFVGKNRARGLVTASIWYAMSVEARRRVLGRAIDAARDT